MLWRKYWCVDLTPEQLNGNLGRLGWWEGSWALTGVHERALDQGVPDPRAPVGNGASQQEVSTRKASEASSAALHCSSSLALPPEPYPPLPPPARVHGKIVFHETGPWYQKAWGPLLSRIPTCDEGWAPVPWSIHWKQNSKLSLNFCLRRLGIHFEPSVVTQDCYQAENSSPGMSSTSVVVLGPRRWALL